MRRNRGRASASTSASGEQGFWPSYADMMSAVALILFFLMLLAYVQNMITGNNLKDTQGELDKTLAQLIDATAKYATKEMELQDISLDLDAAKDALTAQQLLLNEAQNELLAKEAQIAAQEASIAEKQALIDQQTAQYELQQQSLTSTQAELSRVLTQMNDIAVLRVDIVEKIRDSITRTMGDTSTVTVNENGNLVLGESILFDPGKTDLKAESRQVLNQLADSFATFLSNPENSQYVDAIIIGGHADLTGQAESNRTLSISRANVVLNYLLTTQGRELESYSRFFCASGYGDTRPIDLGTEPDALARNRRIEISIVLKDEAVLDVVNEYLKIEMPSTNVG